MMKRSGRTGAGLIIGLVSIIVFSVAYARSCSVARGAEPFPQSKEEQRPATKAEVERLQRQVDELREQVKQLEGMVVELRKGPPAGADPHAHGDAADDDGPKLPSAAEVRDAIKEGRLLIGMTRDEVNHALGKGARNASVLESESAGGVQHYVYGGGLEATFRDGRLVKYSRDVRGPTPSPGGTFNPAGVDPPPRRR